MGRIALNDEHFGDAGVEDRARQRNFVPGRNVHRANMRNRRHELAGEDTRLPTAKGKSGEVGNVEGSGFGHDRANCRRVGKQVGGIARNEFN